VVEENEELLFKNSKAAEAARSVELYQTYKFPEEVLMMLGTLQQSATIERVTCIHVFETRP
jgi:hypothetical protein